MYNPYSNSEGLQNNQQFAANAQNLQHPQPQHAGFQQQYEGQQQAQGQQFPTFLNDPASMLASQFAKNGFNSSNQYIQQNFGHLITGTSIDLKYYFQVSNSYVYKKIFMILLPYANSNWGRLTTSESDASGSGIQFAPPSVDVNAPDLYIPVMSFITYILLWAAFQGLNGDFHPQLFGYLASQTLACSILDISIFKVGLYLLNCSTQGSIWDLISFSSYKYVSVIVILCWKHLVGNPWFSYYILMFFLIANLSVFLMRSLKFLVLHNSITGAATTNSITTKQRRIRIQFLFVYSVVVQGLLILFMSR